MFVSRHRRHDGLKKRCTCPPKDWSRCPHPWHFGFHWQGHEHRYSLQTIAKRERGYVMSKTEAQALADRLRADIRDGKHDSTTVLPESGQTALTFSDIAKEYLKRHGERAQSSEDRRKIDRELRPHPRAVGDITGG